MKELGKVPRWQFLFLATGQLALLAGLWGGILRLGWMFPVIRETLPALHGPLMVSGFLGTLIGMERAVAVNKPWAYASPLFTALGALAFLAGLPWQAGIVLMTLGSLGMVAIFAIWLFRHLSLHGFMMGLGASLWFVGNVLWLLHLRMPIVVFWWLGFLLLTIAGERLELSRLQRPSRWSLFIFLSAILFFLLGLVALLPWPWESIGIRFAGLGMLGLALWLMKNDVARHNLKQVGLPRYISICFLMGYSWLGVSGLLLLSDGIPVGPRYDAILHSFFLGFVFSMIFGHAPLIFPALVGRPILFSPVFYFPLSLLHLSLLLRVSGDWMEWIPARQWGGLFNALAILLFFGSMFLASRRAPVLFSNDDSTS